MAWFGLVRRSPGLAGLLAAQTISPLGDAMAMTAFDLARAADHRRRDSGRAAAVRAGDPAAGRAVGGRGRGPLPAGPRARPGWLAQAVLAGLLALLLPPLGALLAVVFVLALADTPLSAAGRPVHPGRGGR